ncbi:uncharacterized protein LOC118417888 [Branchiostoma floridae]|uniref:Uncharacterized protein LOC118417888 n=1 Tax=Branchiostoma floridae TaxID=7739 RepID=A0A9J7MUL4_BRAFL|nr:uncharacterized protein LOC118417888 [Branchiostoma floridae]
MSCASAPVAQKRKKGAFSVAPRVDGGTLSLLKGKGVNLSPEKTLGGACYSLACRLIGKEWVDQRQLDREVSDITKGQAWLDTYIGAQFRPVQLAPRVVGYFPKHQVAHPRPKTQQDYLHFSSPTQEDASVLRNNNDTCRCCSEPCTTLQEDDLNAWDDMHLKLLFGEEEEDGEGLVTSGSGKHDSLTDVESADKTPVPDNITPVPDGAGALHRTSPWC